MVMNRIALHSEEELCTMEHEELVDYAKHLSIPADSNWTKQQLLDVIDYYQHSKKKKASFFKSLTNGSTSQFLVVVIGLIGIIYSKFWADCPTGLCHLNKQSELDNELGDAGFDQMELNDSDDCNQTQLNQDLQESECIPVVDAVTTLTKEFASVVEQSTSKTQQNYNQIKQSLTDLQGLYQQCRYDVNEAKS
eukprot:269912_1